MHPSSKQIGCCTLCGKEVFEVKGRWPKDHPLAGEVRRVGAPFPAARRASLVLMSGARCSITLCDRCEPTPQRLPELWTVCMQANAQEVDDERRAAVGIREQTDRQREASISTVQQMVVDLPIAVLDVHPWEDDHDLTESA